MTQLTSNKRLKKILLQFYGLAFVTIAAIMAIAKFNNIKISLLVDDPAAFADYPSYVGLLSMIGILILGATAAICFFSAFLFKSTNAKGHRWQRFILVSGLLSLVFVCDDLWLIHENYAMWLGLEKLLPPIPGIGMEDFFEGIVFGLYGMAIAAYLYYFRDIFKHTQMLALIAAIGCLALSATIDILGEQFAIRHHHIPEEIFKLLGFTGWLFYFCLTCRQALMVNSYTHPKGINTH